MKSAMLTAAVLMFFAGTVQAQTEAADASATSEVKRVEKFRIMRSIDSWRPVDRDTLIIWTSPRKPYLVELARGSLRLRHAFAIGLTSTAGNVYERFDSVVVDGVHYPIEAIYELDRDTARRMKRA